MRFGNLIVSSDEQKRIDRARRRVAPRQAITWTLVLAFGMAVFWVISFRFTMSPRAQISMIVAAVFVTSFVVSKPRR